MNHLRLLQLNILPAINPDITGEQFFHQIVQHCNADKAKNLVLVSRLFESTTIKEDGAPLVVRQVSTDNSSLVPLHVLLSSCALHFLFPA